MPVFHGLPKALHWLRIERGLRQGQVARDAGITQAMLSSFERGRRQPTLDSLGKILDSLGASLADLEEALALVTGSTVRRRDRPPEPEASRGPSSIRELGRLLGVEGPLSGEEEQALGQVLSGLRSWLGLRRGSEGS